MTFILHRAHLVYPALLTSDSSATRFRFPSIVVSTHIMLTVSRVLHSAGPVDTLRPRAGVSGATRWCREWHDVVPAAQRASDLDLCSITTPVFIFRLWVMFLLADRTPFQMAADLR